jgi:hypothetical protein
VLLKLDSVPIFDMIKHVRMDMFVHLATTLGTKLLLTADSARLRLSSASQRSNSTKNRRTNTDMLSII